MSSSYATGVAATILVREICQSLSLTNIVPLFADKQMMKFQTGLLSAASTERTIEKSQMFVHEQAVFRLYR